jgi:hypothetical protein
MGALANILQAMDSTIVWPRIWFRRRLEHVGCHLCRRPESRDCRPRLLEHALEATLGT